MQNLNRPVSVSSTTGEVQTLTMNSAGNFVLWFGVAGFNPVEGLTTLNGNSTGTQVLAHLNSIPALLNGNVTVTDADGNPNPATGPFSFRSAAYWPERTCRSSISGSLSGTNPSIATTIEGDVTSYSVTFAKSKAQQRVSLFGQNASTTGSFTLQHSTRQRHGDDRSNSVIQSVQRGDTGHQHPGRELTAGNVLGVGNAIVTQAVNSNGTLSTTQFDVSN